MDSSEEQLLERVRSAPTISSEDHVKAVSTPDILDWTRGHESPFAASSPGAPGADAVRLRIVAYDFGAKRNILRSLVASGFDVTVVPADTPAAAVLERNPDGVFLSNGPGDPATQPGLVATIRILLAADVPLFGICLGHQLLARALGAETAKLPFGHHGANHPVQNLETGRVEITSQNHNYAVPKDSLDPAVARPTHLSLNDGSVEGLEAVGRDVYSVQFHPEAAPGPSDSLYLFQRFRRAMLTRREPAQLPEVKRHASQG
jgi:carbamoyl-phosphate synthase small subunit